MLLSTVSVLVVAQSSSEIPEGVMNNPVYIASCEYFCLYYIRGSECGGGGTLRSNANHKQ